MHVHTYPSVDWNRRVSILVKNDSLLTGLILGRSETVCNDGV